MELKKISILDREYLVSDLGDVFTSSGHKISKHLRHGYEYVTLQVDKVKKKYSVHRLVCSAFHSNQNSLEQVNHIDGNTRNNRVDNLEWVNSSSNQIHSRYVLGNQTGFKDTPVRCVETNEVYVSTRDAWRQTGINYCHISECASGKRKSAGGFHWESLKEVV